MDRNPSVMPLGVDGHLNSSPIGNWHYQECPPCILLHGGIQKPFLIHLEPMHALVSLRLGY